MSDDNAVPIGTAGLDASTAGAMLRAAREKRGLHIAALAASIKVSPRKLEALEADRYAELPDLTFTRALAQTVCRALKVDAAPVLAKLPQAGDLPKLARVGGGINTPFREAATSRDPGEFTLHRKPVFWATLLVLLGALALAILPERWMPWRAAQGETPSKPAITPVAMPPLPQAPPAATSVVATSPAAAASEAVPSEAASFVPAPSAAASESTAGAPAPPLTLRTSAESWIDVQDGHGQTLLSRNVLPGEDVGLDGTLPMRVTIGNAAATQLVFRGKPVNLAASTRDNVARLQLP